MAVRVRCHLDRTVPILVGTTLRGSSRPPSTFRLMHHEAKKWRRPCRAYFALPFSSTMRASICAGMRPLTTMLARPDGRYSVEGADDGHSDEQNHLLPPRAWDLMLLLFVGAQALHFSESAVGSDHQVPVPSPSIRRQTYSRNRTREGPFGIADCWHASSSGAIAPRRLPGAAKI